MTISMVAVWIVAGAAHAENLGVEAGDPHSMQADVAIVNARIWTGADPPVPGRDSAGGGAAGPTALAVADQKIVAVGDDGSMRALIGPSTRVIDARGKRIIPGITDSHTHIVSGGLGLTQLALRDVRNQAEFVRAVEAAAEDKRAGQWVVGGRWSVESWADAPKPSKTWLDATTRDVPVFLSRMDGHQALVNSAALRAAGIDASGPADPPGGEIERDPATKEPTGILKESAMELVRRHIPAPSLAERYEALRRGMNHANSLGITSVHDMSEREDLEVFRKAYEAGALTVRITAYLSVSDWSSHMEVVAKYAVRDDMYRVAGFKGYMDGSLGSRTAFMREPYSDAGSQALHPRGQLNAMADPPESFSSRVVQADAAGLQLAVHAIGDQANHLLLEAYAAAFARNRVGDRRHRIEHAQHLLVEDFPRFAALGVVASMQPFHKADDGRYAERALGKERLAGSYAFRQLVDAGALVCFGSDFPVVTMNPFAGIDAAVNAKTLAGEVWLPSHSLTLTEALRAYTANAARAIHREHKLGTLEVGKLADIVILAADPFTLPIERVGDVKVWQTIVGGKVVYAHPE